MIIPTVIIAKHFFEAHRNNKTNFPDPFIFNANGLNFIYVKYKNKNLKFLLDTGASISVIFKNVIDKTEKINCLKKIKINGVSGTIISQGSANLCLNINGAKVCHEFLLIDSFEDNVHGLIGTDFFMRYLAKLDYENFHLSFNVNNKQILTSIHSKFENYTCIPARHEVIKYFHTNTDEECVVLPDEICEGVFVAAILVKSNSNRIPVRILNTRNQDVNIKKFCSKNCAIILL